MGPRGDPALRVDDVSGQLPDRRQRAAGFDLGAGVFAYNSVTNAAREGVRLAIVNQDQASIETRAIDSYIGTGYHLLAILKESLYQLRHYAPAYEQEKAEVKAIEDMARRLKYTFSPEESRELEHLRSLADLSMKLSAENEALSRRMAARCRDLLHGTAQVILRNLEGAAENEVLVQNLLQNRGLLDRVYGAGAAERIFLGLCRGREIAGTTGVDRARSYVRKHCGNVDGL